MRTSETMWSGAPVAEAPVAVGALVVAADSALSAPALVSSRAPLH